MAPLMLSLFSPQDEYLELLGHQGRPSSFGTLNVYTNFFALKVKTLMRSSMSQRSALSSSLSQSLMSVATWSFLLRPVWSLLAAIPINSYTEKRKRIFSSYIFYMDIKRF